MPLVTLSIKGKDFNWAVTADMPEHQIEAMRSDGVDVGLLQNTAPVWVVDLGLMRPWFFLQDLWNLKSPFKV